MSTPAFTPLTDVGVNDMGERGGQVQAAQPNSLFNNNLLVTVGLPALILAIAVTVVIYVVKPKWIQDDSDKKKKTAISKDDDDIKVKPVYLFFVFLTTFALAFVTLYLIFNQNPSKQV